MKHTKLLLALLLALAAAHAHAETAGRLIIVGGALAEDNDAVHRAFIAAADAAGPERKILIVPAASGYPTESAEKFRTQLLRRGVAEARVRVLPLAVKDDPTTPALDESAWAGNGADPALADEAREAGAFWFVGGDQSRIAAVLLDPAGADRPVLAAIRAAHARGAALGGTSAGAAIMSDPMILGGDSLGALRHGMTRDYTDMDEQESGPLIIGRGLGFFTFGLVDQHFDRKARHARLVVALARGGVARGYGIDENTALLVDPVAATGEVVGGAGVTVFDAGAAEFSPADAPFAARGVRVSVLAAGDRVDLRDGEITPASVRKPARGREFFNLPEPALGSALVPYGSFRDLAGPLLVDNRGANTIHAVAFAGAQGGEGWRLVLGKDERTTGHTGGGGTTVAHALLTLEPVRVTITPR